MTVRLLRSIRICLLVGIYFSDTPPDRRLITPGIPGFFGLLAGIDIPPGEKAYTIKGRWTTPADMRALSVTAHAHYLGKDFKVTATLPDGSTTPLLWIQDWDFNWQDRYDKDEEERLRQRGGAALKAAVAKAAQSDIVKRYLSQQRRFMEDAGREGTDGCGAR